MRAFRAVLGLSAVLGCSTLARAVLPGQIDTFQDGTSMGWADGHGSFTVISSGGPAGAGDQFLEIVNDSHSVILNRAQWTGNFTGMGSVSMQLKNFTVSTKPMRIALLEDTIGQTSRAYVSTTPFSLIADNAWHNVTFNLDSASLTPLNSPDSLATALTQIAEFRILAATGTTLVGDSSTGAIGVDNIRVPEPASLALVAVGGCLALRRRR